MTADESPSRRSSSFRKFFVRGLAILLPTVLTLWILVMVYNFVNDRIASQINLGVQEAVLRMTPWPAVSDQEIQEYRGTSEGAAAWVASGRDRLAFERAVRRHELRQWWQQWLVLDLIGLIIAIVLIYIVGLLAGSYLGNRLYARGEQMLTRVPIIKQIYPSVKQVVNFVVGDADTKVKFNRVVAVEYPRRGMWSLGLVTGETMRNIQNAVKQPCNTVFIPSSPTPFTGYVITVPTEDTLELNISIDEALRFTVSGGVVVPDSQLLEQPLAADTPEQSSESGQPEPTSADRPGSAASWEPPHGFQNQRPEC